MYSRPQEGWLKHFDFCLLDILCYEIALFIANYVRYSGGMEGYFNQEVYREMALIGILASIAVAVFSGTFRDILKKDIMDDIYESVKQTTFVVIILLLYLYLMHRAVYLSRIVYGLTCILYFTLGLTTKLIWKLFLKKIHKGRGTLLLVITRYETAQKCLQEIHSENYEMFRIAGLVITDRSIVGEEIDGIPVVADGSSLLDYIQSEWINAVFLDDTVDEVMRSVFTQMICEMGVVVHEKLLTEENPEGENRSIGHIGSCVVLTTSMNSASSTQLFFKRLMDIAGGLVGTILTGILFIPFSIVIHRQSPGPVFFKQTRIGRNGKEFEMYKFRTMYPDAEERKKDLMEENRVDSDYMFKLDFDPRVIGNEILPDGTRKTGFMEFARRCSLDEFPQFPNVLKGDMSLVGTRPPTAEEYKLYKRHHHARLAIRPGITGLWQVSGRSNITDFEEVVRLDKQYINEWNLWLDIKILFKTVKVVLKKEGSM